MDMNSPLSGLAPLLREWTYVFKGFEDNPRSKQNVHVETNILFLFSVCMLVSESLEASSFSGKVGNKLFKKKPPPQQKSNRQSHMGLP